MSKMQLVSEKCSKQELLPCPFCGSEARIFSCVDENPDEYPYQPRCTDEVNCGCELAWFEIKQEAVKAWNSRSK